MSNKSEGWARQKAGPATLDELFEKQKEFQRLIVGFMPHDNVTEFEYHITAMVEELGEILKADKRWKTHRNTRFVPEEKLDEIADMFITAINIALWSGFSSEDISSAILNKIKRNNRRWRSKNDSNC